MSPYKYSTFIFLLLSLGRTPARSQVDWVVEAGHMKLSEDRIYIFCRGTRSKAYLLAHKFNMRDTNSTHVGIGFYHDQRFFIYNVIDEAPKDKTALVVDSLSSFLSSNEVYYFSLWECANNQRELALLKQQLTSYVNRKITFDTQFRLAEDDSLYCSEFCAQVLNNFGGGKFEFFPLNKPLNNPLFEAVLGRRNISYYPVDFFQTSAFVRKVYEWRIE